MLKLLIIVHVLFYVCFIQRPLHFIGKSHPFLFLFLWYLHFGTFLSHMVSCTQRWRLKSNATLTKAPAHHISTVILIYFRLLLQIYFLI